MFTEIVPDVATMRTVLILFDVGMPHSTASPAWNEPARTYPFGVLTETGASRSRRL